METVVISIVVLRKVAPVSIPLRGVPVSPATVNAGVKRVGRTKISWKTAISKAVMTVLQRALP